MPWQLQYLENVGVLGGLVEVAIWSKAIVITEVYIV